MMDVYTMGAALVVGGFALLCSGLIFLLPTPRKPSSDEGSDEEE